MAKNNSRNRILIGIAAALLLGLVYAFWPQPLLVDIGEAEVTPMVLTIDEEAKTRVHDAYIVSVPIAGRLMRIDVEPGDTVIGGETVIANLFPTPSAALDARSREQADASVDAALAAVRLARSELNAAIANQDLAQTQFNRYQGLAPVAASQERLDQAERELRSANAAVETAKSAISMREADLARARAELISFSETPPLGEVPEGDMDELYQNAIPLTAPISGQILRVIQRSEITLPTGAQILEIGNVSNDLEVVAELLSTDAVRVKPGQRVIIESWGGPGNLEGVVERVEPWGFTKFSALGVEEQRVNAIIQFTNPISERVGLGHGFRIETRIVVWEDDDALTVPSAALFRDGAGWAVFVVEGGRARVRPVEVAHNNGVKAAIASGLDAGQRLVLYPGPTIKDGSRVDQRKIRE